LSRTIIEYVGETGSRILLKITHDGEFIAYGALIKAHISDYPILGNNSSEETSSRKEAT